ncbi:unnamed protein product, partial [Symbiodinium sp. KB8]
FLATFGMAAKNMFDYNRENFQFDQEQRQSRELLRQTLQLKRFTLFREDIRDLVELTVGKMEMYHLVAALFMESSMALYFEGRIRHIAPPFVIGLLFISIASAYMYLLLAVWLSMHASICSHSLGVRLLTRFVRLPVPGMQQMGALNARLADYERQGVKNMLRVPVVGATQQWGKPGQRLDAIQEGQPSAGTDFLGEGVKAFNKDDNILGTAQGTLGKHVELFRKLQSKWQCFDAYARVCMALGANQLLLGLQYYLVVTCIIQYRCPSLCFALIAGFNSGGLVLATLDLAGIGVLKVIFLQMLGSVPVWIAAISLVMAKKSDEGIPLQTEDYPAAPLAYFLNLLWFEGLLWVAWPSQDEAALPRLFRSVIFLDVFEDAGTVAVEAEPQALHKALTRQATMNLQSTKAAPEPLDRTEVRRVDRALFLAHSALRRWEALPRMNSYNEDMRNEIQRLRRDFNLWHETFLGELSKRNKVDPEAVLPMDLRAWHELNDEEKKELDPFRGALLGPFRGADSQAFYYNLEGQTIDEAPHEDSEVLGMDQVRDHVEAAERAVQKLQGPGANNFRYSSSSDSDSDSSDGPRRGKSFVFSGNKKSWMPSLDHTPHLQRLPWKVLFYCTRSLQVGWLLMTVIYVLELFGLFELNVQVDKQKESIAEDGRLEEVEEEGHGVAEEQIGHGERRLGLRRLLGLLPWGRPEPDFVFRRWPVPWPSALIRPDSLHLSAGELVIGTPYQLYRAVPGSNSSWPLRRIAALQPKEDFAVGEVPLCEEAGSCLKATLSEGFLRLSLSGAGSESAVARISGSPWRNLAGIQVPCESLQTMLSAAQPEPVQGRCLLIAGWDGVRLPVAVIRRPMHGEQWPEVVHPFFDVPFKIPAGRPGALEARARPAEDSCAASNKEVLSLTLEPDAAQASLRLWALREGGELFSWELLSGRTLGRWNLPGFGRDFEAAAICTGQASGQGRAQLILAGRSRLGGQPIPELLISKIPNF